LPINVLFELIGDNKMIETKNFSIGFSNPDYAYFEHNQHGDEHAGGLWFKDKVLFDYDGVFELDNEIIQALENKGYNMDYAKD
jgi:hypothetical protein